MSIVDQLNKIEDQYPRRSLMPANVLATYDRLNAVFVNSVFTARVKDHGSIHSHLDKGEKNGS